MRLPLHFALLFVLTTTVPTFAQIDPTARPTSASTDALGKYLRELGFEPKALSPDVFQITVERERWPVHIMMSLSTDGRRVWLECKFAPVEEPDKVPPATWKRLLEANEKIGPAHFAFDKADKRVHLYKSFDNQDLSAERLKREIEHFDTTVRKTQDYWRGENFKPVVASNDPAVAPVITAPSSKKGGDEPPSGPPDMPAIPGTRLPRDIEQLEGEWSVIEIQIKGRKAPVETLKERQVGLTVHVQSKGVELRSGESGFTHLVKANLRIGPGRWRYVRVEFPQPVILAPLGGPRTGDIDFVDEQNQVEQGIYRVEGDTLTLCFAAPGDPRPTAFKTDEQSRNWLFVLKKTK